MSGHDWLIILRDVVIAMTWFVASVFFLSGCQDFMYDVGAYAIRIFRRLVWYKKNPRLTLERLRAREQQKIAVLVPAWNEGEVVASMVDNIINKVEYRNYVIFVGVYPNDPPTNDAVDRLSAQHAQIIKVVNSRPGPTTKADCLNNVLRTLKVYEAREGVNFDIIVMHDAEDVVHPHSFMLYNYLIPKVDAVQIPILPLPTNWRKWVHWVYADEFSENHMKDVPVREKISGFVPFAGTGTGFSRRSYTLLEQKGFQIFNESSMTEDYSLSKRMKEHGLKAIFVNVVLGDGKSKWWTPLCNRPEFIANWAYFPMDFTRSVRQKTRWIIGISLQEWEQGGWGGNLRMKENFVKDRKVFIAAGTSFVGYFVLIYFALFAMGSHGWISLRLEPVIEVGTPLYVLVQVATAFMILRAVQRIIFVGMTYGVGPGLMSVPRLAVGNVINGLAAFRALQAFSHSRQGKAAVRWDNTLHVEGVGELPTGNAAEEASHGMEGLSIQELLKLLSSDDPVVLARALNSMPRDLWEQDKRLVIRVVSELSNNPNSGIKSATARAIGFLQWPELVPWLFMLLHSPDWLVRSNAARALLKQPNATMLLEQTFYEGSADVCEVVTKTLEADSQTQQVLFPMLDRPELRHAKPGLLNSEILSQNYKTYLEEHQS